MAKPPSDYLAVISIAGGAGSWARDPDREKAIKRVIGIFKSDFKSIIKIAKGTKIKIDLLDVTGHNDVWWDSRGYWIGEQPLHCPIERLEHTY
jgi:hypothetical protein